MDVRMHINLCSYNMHGYNNGLSLVRYLFLKYDVVLLQEHRLLKVILPNLVTFIMTLVFRGYIA